MLVLYPRCDGFYCFTAVVVVVGSGPDAYAVHWPCSQLCVIFSLFSLVADFPGLVYFSLVPRSLLLAFPGLSRIAGMSADFRSLAFLYGANKSSDEDWRFVWSVYQNSTFDSDRALLMGALTAFKTDKIIKR